MKRLIVLIWLLGIKAGLLLYWAEASSFTDARPNITITDISNEDFLKANRKKFNLHDINAQERKQICSNAEGENYANGKQTTNWLRYHIKTGDHLFYVSLDIDKYRWLIVLCFKSGKKFIKPC